MTTDTTPIDRFDGDWAFLSNFHPSPFDLDGRRWPTVEHAFQAFKTHDRDAQEAIRLAPTPAKAKRAGRAVALRPDWDDVRDTVMADCLAAKFGQDPDLAARLIATGDRQLVEGNHWQDRYWGVCDGVGQNRLGTLLMDLRARLTDGTTP